MVANAYKTYTRKQNRKNLKSNYLVQYKSDFHQTYITQYTDIVLDVRTSKC